MKNLCNKLYAYWLVAYSRILKRIYKRPSILTPEETIDYINKNRCSIGRFGDGELDILLGIRWKDSFQRFNPLLKKKLAKLRTNEKFLVCLPDTIIPGRLTKELLVKQEYDFWSVNIHQFEGFWRKLASKNNVIGNSFISRFYIRYNDRRYVSQYIEKLKTIWDDRDIIFIEGADTRCGIGNNLFDNARSIKRILCPTTQAFDRYNAILEAAVNSGEKDSLFLIALGQTATVLAKDLSDQGYQALDVGHMDVEYEWYLAKAEKKIPITNKYVNEAVDGRNSAEYSDSEYTSQILVKIQ
jgi:glycosyltransferase family protein